MELTKLGLTAYWVEHLNDWAYESLGCAGFYSPGGFAHDDGLTALRRKLQEVVEVEE